MLPAVQTVPSGGRTDSGARDSNLAITLSVDRLSAVNMLHGGALTQDPPDNESDSDSADSMYFDAPPGETEQKLDDDADDMYASDVPATVFQTYPAPNQHIAPKQDNNLMKAAQLDLSMSIRGMYRILDLINEQGTGGFVEKIIIAQETLQKYINAHQPGAYESITKLDWRALDRLSVRPVGVYGSKIEIVRLLKEISCIDDNIASLALASNSGRDNQPVLRSGIYFVDSPSEASVTYVLYWPEDTTWNDNATSPVCKNRVTFMRYLTKLSDQVIALLSPEHAGKLVFDTHLNEDGRMTNAGVGKHMNRLFTFDVIKKNEQEENVTARPGFRIASSLICPKKNNSTLPDHLVDKLRTRLIHGETHQAFMTCRYHQASSIFENLAQDKYDSGKLRNLIMGSGSLTFGHIPDDAIEILMEHGLAKKFPPEVARWKSRREIANTEYKTALSRGEVEIKENLQKNDVALRTSIRRSVIIHLKRIYPMILLDKLADDESLQDHSDYFEQLRLMHTQIDGEFEKWLRETFDTLSPDFQKLKVVWFTIQVISDSPHIRSDLKADMIKKEYSVMSASPVGAASESYAATFKANLSNFMPVTSLPTGWNPLKSYWNASGSHNLDLEIKTIAKQRARSVTDAQFLADLCASVTPSETEESIKNMSIALAQSYLLARLEKQLNSIYRRISRLQGELLERQLALIEQRKYEQMDTESRKFLLTDIQKRSASQSQGPALHLDAVECLKSAWNSQLKMFVLQGKRQVRSEPSIGVTVHCLTMSSHDRHESQLNAAHVPSPAVEDARLTLPFNIPLDSTIAHIQLIESNTLLLIITAPNGDARIYLNSIAAMEGAICQGHAKSSLRRDKIGLDPVFTYDEGKRTLAIICSRLENAESLDLHLMVFDESYGSLNPYGSITNLRAWYLNGEKAKLACFVPGAEELLIIDNTMHARIFSVITQQFRPASVQLLNPPKSVFSTPDGSCAMLIYEKPGPGWSNTTCALHWTTFGSSEGFDLDLPSNEPSEWLVSSLHSRNNIYVIGIEMERGCIVSIALDITKRATQFEVHSRDGRRTGRRSGVVKTYHNSLLDCHAEVWTRFPVVPAIQRYTFVTSRDRRPKALIFATSPHSALAKFAPYMQSLISSFERTTRKPTGNILSDLIITAMLFEDITWPHAATTSASYSLFGMGEWLVDLLCLIPIHIAITKENRFVPLKDGVTSAAFERDLLGADLNFIVDQLSFGWYESIFKSYMATKPVKVVSSMGEQSVGKSFALNHLVDTSFAGSAMRTTEGVWMSVTPTQDNLIVALDFEGVHSLERSAQEDSLLVLFNTALSNLVIFRNNFALSRNVAELFRSFQSSSTVFDPDANPSLFQSTLVVVIKDVIETDQDEIAREFSTKFSSIVQQEQEANFLTRLHRGKFCVIPWPVIESQEFYMLFLALKDSLENQITTHRTGAEFLLTLKTLMAKLKTNDWGSMAQTLAAHRAQQLLALLPNALSWGAARLSPNFEPLTDMDTSEPIESPDTHAIFYLTAHTPGDHSAFIQTLVDEWLQSNPRDTTTDQSWTETLGNHLKEIADSRIRHIDEWISANLSRFTATHDTINELKRTFQDKAGDLLSNIQICKLKCQDCHLTCLLHRSHGGEHNCRTSHRCLQTCRWDSDHMNTPQHCGHPAGHTGEHICDVSIHRCGHACSLQENRGCLMYCNKDPNHGGDDHMCSALVHECGEPCAISSSPRLSNGSPWCQGQCSIPSDQRHDVHVCDSRGCPITCELCKRLCANDNHLHGLMKDSMHLCGQEHTCNKLCAADGICEIDTTPQSIQATFTGKHETFQYTKYSQVAKRLKCAVSIPSLSLKHIGPHIHSLDEKPFHYCETQCVYCGYYCTLPRGHAQKEHETSHGSMSKTSWLVEGADGTTIQLDGRKYASSDEGAPMMCNLLCASMSRHSHVTYCRTPKGAPCVGGGEKEHISKRMSPNPDKPKDWITHDLFWRRSGFKDPYSQDERLDFAKCDHMCPGDEHKRDATSTTNPQPSFCIMPMFHPPALPNMRAITRQTGLGYVSTDGHVFLCKNPEVLQQAYHIIFVIDRSYSMGSTDRRPLLNTPSTARIEAVSNNRLGAVYSALYAFWTSRLAAAGSGGRRDAYSIILFDHQIEYVVLNDFSRTPDDLLDLLLAHTARRGTNFELALGAGRQVMEHNWSSERAPVMLFLSDGECYVEDQVVQALCQTSARLGKSLSLHTVFFGSDTDSMEILRRMATTALTIQNGAQAGTSAGTVRSSFQQVLSSVQLTQAFLAFAESLKKPRGALLNNSLN